ncbi:hypothetical protein Cylst_2579 [Cylindrospermum stagnale PCC 7417]|uniref:Uncharacterized protein n=2 Tax=Cylindrospermum stagnale TaxID=142864 RepID=K9WWM5_9NOST|nr:hypothetical protein Cylst_2579 [Cylindrospermum stagnale PCC 7417]
MYTSEPKIMETKSRLFIKDSLTEKVLELSIEEQEFICGGQGTNPNWSAFAAVYSPVSPPNNNPIRF